MRWCASAGHVGESIEGLYARRAIHEDRESASMTPEQMIIMVSLGCSALQAMAEYTAIESILINLAHPHPISGGIVTADKLNVRETPGANAKIVGVLALDAMIEVWGRTPASDWLCIKDPCGWVSSQYVQEI